MQQKNNAAKNNTAKKIMQQNFTAKMIPLQPDRISNNL